MENIMVKLCDTGSRIKSSKIYLNCPRDEEIKEVLSKKLIVRIWADKNQNLERKHKMGLLKMQKKKPPHKPYTIYIVVKLEYQRKKQTSLKQSERKGHQ